MCFLSSQSLQNQTKIVYSNVPTVENVKLVVILSDKIWAVNFVLSVIFLFIPKNII